MAIIQNEILKFEIKNITSLYAEFSDIDNENDIGAYESFDCKIQIGDVIILNKNLELCSGNIQELLKGINSILLDGNISNFQLDFCELDLEFNIETLLEDNYLFTIWCYTYVLGSKNNGLKTLSVDRITLTVVGNRI